MNEQQDTASATELNILPVSAPPSRNTTLGEGGRRKWVYADIAAGRFAQARNIVYSVLIVFYIVAPWLKIGSEPFLRFDLPARRFSIFGTTFVATDLYLLALFLLLAAVAMFLFSALLGRLWCGWACPQTVYLEGVFRRIERWIEGSPLKRRKLDSGPRDGAYWSKKTVKIAAFFIVSALLSLSFVAYFISPQGVLEMLRSGGASHPAAMVTTLVVTGITLWNFAWFREQFCTFLCPYARFQSVMLDDHSLIVGYDPQRGEPRSPLRPDHSWDNRGDCIDCKRCVQVCPTGIDIRNGLQLECVSCTACIDACDAVMDRIERPRGLIRYDSLAGLAGRPQKIIRRRVVLYSLVMIVVLGVFSSRLLSREAVGLTITRSAGIPFMVQDDGKVRNLFTVHITNTDVRPLNVHVEADGPAGLQTIVPGDPFTIAAGQRLSTEVFVLLPREQVAGSETPITFRLMTGDTLLSRAPTIFLGPARAVK